eukprot:TRINITY_DN68096_c0_g1_i1.p1 TRINITY_DN68096_c0_g1~~TRINITY_DN68096_c0_g1_i1.p1  ORF type:complete len:224 (+),score=52.19 TRINITY_DN68096_c0_g1_i1:102-773(+)
MGQSIGCNCYTDTTSPTVNVEPEIQKTVDDKKPAAAEVKKVDRTEEVSKKLGIAVKNLRVRAARSQTDAWKKVNGEFDVQKMIWQSQSLARGGQPSGATAIVESKIGNALAGDDKEKASELLSAAVQTAEADTLGAGLRQAVLALKASIEHAKAKEELAKIIEKDAGSPDVNLPDMLQKCGMNDAKFETAIKALWKMAGDIRLPDKAVKLIRPGSNVSQTSLA